MGSSIEINDTLQISREQGFPVELDLDTHLKERLVAHLFTGRIFTFKDKPGIRIFQAPPVRNFLVENRSGKWIYWGLIEILAIKHDHVNRSTSGSFKITHLYSPEEMRIAHDLIDQREETRFFNE